MTPSRSPALPPSRDFGAAQLLLPLVDAPGSDASLRAAYAATSLADNGISFARTMRNDALRRCLANIGHARLKARLHSMRGNVVGLMLIALFLCSFWFAVGVAVGWAVHP